MSNRWPAWRSGVSNSPHWTPAGGTVNTGHRFTIHDQPEAEWLTAQPRIASGGHLLPDGLNLPHPLRASLHWRKRTFGIKRKYQRSGWLLPLDDGRLFGPAKLLSPVEGAIDENTALEIAGQRMAIVTSQSHPFGLLATHAMPTEITTPKSRWPASRNPIPRNRGRLPGSYDQP